MPLCHLEQYCVCLGTIKSVINYLPRCILLTLRKFQKFSVNLALLLFLALRFNLMVKLSALQFFIFSAFWIRPDVPAQTKSIYIFGGNLFLVNLGQLNCNYFWPTFLYLTNLHHNWLNRFCSQYSKKHWMQWPIQSSS